MRKDNLHAEQTNSTDPSRKEKDKDVEFDPEKNCINCTFDGVNTVKCTLNPIQPIKGTEFPIGSTFTDSRTYGVWTVEDIDVVKCTLNPIQPIKSTESPIGSYVSYKYEDVDVVKCTSNHTQPIRSISTDDLHGWISADKVHDAMNSTRQYSNIPKYQTFVQPVYKSGGRPSDWDRRVAIPIWETANDAPFDEDREIAMALKYVTMEPTPQDYLEEFIDLIRNKRVPQAFSLYYTSRPDTRQVIDDYLDRLPWRVSHEYCRIDKHILWKNTWVKIGWWSHEEFELSSQLNKGSWVSESGSSRAINTSCFECVVWSGIGTEIVRRLLLSEDNINVELEVCDDVSLDPNGKDKDSDKDYFFTPINVAFSQASNTNNVFDLVPLEIGSVTGNTENYLDIFRTPYKSKKNADGTLVSYYKGCTLGTVFIPEGVPIDDIYRFDETDDPDLDLVDYEDEQDLN